MNKIFMALLFLTLAGAGVLFWLMRTLPGPNGAKSHTEATAEHSLEESGNHAKDEHGGDEHGSGGHESAEHGTADHGDAAKEHAKAAHPSEENESEHGKAETKHASEGGAHAASKESEKPMSIEDLEFKGQSLSINTTPVSAIVSVDGEVRGQTPLEIALGPISMKVKLEAPGYGIVEKDAPIVKPGNSLDILTWNFPLKPQNEPRSKVAHEKSTGVFVHGRKGPVWLQVKSLADDSSGTAESAIEKYRSDFAMKNIVGCKVDLAEKGKWTRVLVGPYNNKVAAKMAADLIQAKTSEAALVTGVQRCL